MAPIPIFKTLSEMMDFYYGPTKLIRKATEVSETAGSGTHWEPLYGKKVWSFLNLEANVFAIIPKEPWVKSGWRIITTAANASGGGIAESTTGGSVPAAAAITFAQVKTKPKTVAHTFDLGELAKFLGGVDDAVELLPTYREEVGKEHASCINKMLIGDADTAAGNNFESVDRVISSKAEETGGRYTAGDLDIYGIDKDTGYDAYVSHNSNTDRDLSLSIIDTVLQNVWDNGGLPKVILTKTNTLMRWQQLLEAERRFMDTARVVPTFGGVRGPAPGVEAGFLVATYFGVPIIPSIDVPNCSTIGGIYFIDTDFLKFAVAKPTTYAETGKGEGFLYRALFATEGMYETMGELRAYRFNCHGKVADLK
jgi:hypothetical protein